MRLASIAYGQKGLYMVRGWCVWDAVRPELGSKGLFATRAAAEAWAADNGFDGIDEQSASKHSEIPGFDWREAKKSK